MRALGSETALQPTSGQRARSLGVTAQRHAELATRAGSSYIGFGFCFAVGTLPMLVGSLGLSTRFFVLGRDCGLDGDFVAIISLIQI